MGNTDIVRGPLGNASVDIKTSLEEINDVLDKKWDRAMKSTSKSNLSIRSSKRSSKSDIRKASISFASINSHSSADDPEAVANAMWEKATKVSQTLQSSAIGSMSNLNADKSKKGRNDIIFASLGVSGAARGPDDPHAVANAKWDRANEVAKSAASSAVNTPKSGRASHLPRKDLVSKIIGSGNGIQHVNKKIDQHWDRAQEVFEKNEEYLDASKRGQNTKPNGIQQRSNVVSKIIGSSMAGTDSESKIAADHWSRAQGERIINGALLKTDSPQMHQKRAGIKSKMIQDL